VQVDPAFKTQYAAFLADGAAVGAPQSVDDLIIKFDDVNKYGCAEGRVGCCFTQSHETPVVVIDKAAWQGASSAYRSIIIYHELGHCVLNRQHDNATHAGGAFGIPIPASVMQANFSGYLPDLFTDFHEDYAKELFGKGIGPTPFGN